MKNDKPESLFPSSLILFNCRLLVGTRLIISNLIIQQFGNVKMPQPLQHIESMQRRNSVSLHIPSSAYYLVTLRGCDISTYLIILLLIASIDCNRCQSFRSSSVRFQFILLFSYSSSFHFFFSTFQASACHSHSSTG